METISKADFIADLERILRVLPGTISESDKLSAFRSWDSLATMEFVSLVEERFDLTIPERRISECKLVCDLLGLVSDRLRG